MSMLNLVIGIFIAMLVAMVLLGGIKRIGSVTEKLVPFMALFYVVMALGVVVLNIRTFRQSLLLLSEELSLRKHSLAVLSEACL